MKKFILTALAVLGLGAMIQACTLDTEGELFGEGLGADAAPDAQPDVPAETGNWPDSGSGGNPADVGSGGQTGTGGASGAGGQGGSAGIGGASGDAGSAGSGGVLSDAGEEDAVVGPDVLAEAADDAAVEAGPDVAPDAVAEDAVSEALPDSTPDVVAEDAAPDVTDAAEEPDAPWPTSPCGPYPPTGYVICWVYDHPSFPGLHLGLAGGVASPGHFIENEWKDPMVGITGNCVAPTGQQSYVLCQLATSYPIGTLVQFAAGLHQNSDAPTESNNWACGLQQCYGEAYVYLNGTEIGKYVGGQGYGKLHTIPHFVTASHLDLGFNIP